MGETVFEPDRPGLARLQLRKVPPPLVIIRRLCIYVLPGTANEVLFVMPGDVDELDITLLPEVVHSVLQHRNARR